MTYVSSWKAVCSGSELGPSESDLGCSSAASLAACADNLSQVRWHVRTFRDISERGEWSSERSEQRGLRINVCLASPDSVDVWLEQRSSHLLPRDQIAVLSLSKEKPWLSADLILILNNTGACCESLSQRFVAVCS